MSSEEANQLGKSLESQSQSPTPTPPIIFSSDGGNKKSELSPDAPSKKASVQASETASLAAVVEAACCHRNLIPGLNECLEATPSLGNAVWKGVSSKNNNSGDEGAINKKDNNSGHPILPSMNTLSNTVLKFINDLNLPPFVTMSTKDSAPQLKLEDPPIMTAENNNFDNSSSTKLNIRRRLVVKGAIRGYRMSRATHGVSNGCYYYEAIIGGKKRPLHESSNEEASDLATKRQKIGHIRIGWSTRSGDLQAPVGYDAFSYAIRDTGGSRIHKSWREDKWGGKDFGPGDVVGFAICLPEENTNKLSTTVNSTNVDGTNTSTVSHTTKPESPTGSYIRFYINGKQIRDKAFDDITPGTYFPAVSCYSNSSVKMNFGPHFVYPQKDVRPVSDLCLMPPHPEDVLDTVLTKGKDGKKAFSSKKVDERVAAAFKDLVMKESDIRHCAYQQHTSLQKQEVLKLREERCLLSHDVKVATPAKGELIDGRYTSMRF